MTYEEQAARRVELRKNDPHGRLSGNDIDRIVLVEDLEGRIDEIPVDHLKNLLRDLLSLVRAT